MPTICHYQFRGSEPRDKKRLSQFPDALTLNISLVGWRIAKKTSLQGRKNEQPPPPGYISSHDSNYLPTQFTSGAVYALMGNWYDSRESRVSSSVVMVHLHAEFNLWQESQFWGRTTLERALDVKSGCRRLIKSNMFGFYLLPIQWNRFSRTKGLSRSTCSLPGSMIFCVFHFFASWIYYIMTLTIDEHCGCAWIPICHILICKDTGQSSRFQDNRNGDRCFNLVMAGKTIRRKHKHESR